LVLINLLGNVLVVANPPNPTSTGLEDQHINDLMIIFKLLFVFFILKIFLKKFKIFYFLF
jgi:hypothetical protein